MLVSKNLNINVEPELRLRRWIRVSLALGFKTVEKLLEVVFVPPRMYRMISPELPLEVVEPRENVSNDGFGYGRHHHPRL